MLSQTKLTQIDPSCTQIILPDEWNDVYKDDDFSKITDEKKGYIYSNRTKWDTFYGFKIQVEFKNMLGSLTKNEPVMKDKKFMALFQKNNMLQALVEKETLDKQDKEEKQQVFNMKKKKKKERNKEIEFY